MIYDKLYYDMMRIRMIEEAIAKRYPEQKMRCPVHLSIGQEAAAVGVCAALEKEDKMVSTHRGHAHYLAKGGSLNGLIGELHGKHTGCSRGYGGSMHLLDLSCNFWGSTSIVGGTIPYGVGLAFADHLKNRKSVTVVCIGDAAIEEGVFHEAANFASLHSLAVVFVCENNQYSCYTHITQRQPKRHLKWIAKAHSLHYLQAKNTVEDVLKKTKEAVYLARTRFSPVFLQIPVWRFLEHCGPNNDDHLGYRDAQESHEWREQDPIAKKEDWDLLQVQYIQDEITRAFNYAQKAEDAKPMSCYAT